MDIVHRRTQGRSNTTTCGLEVFGNEENRKHNFSTTIRNVTCPDCLKKILSDMGLNLEGTYSIGDVGDSPIENSDNSKINQRILDIINNHELKYYKREDMTKEQAEEIVKVVGMEDRKPEQHNLFTTIGFCEGSTDCLFCGESIFYNSLKSAPLYCINCVDIARKLVAGV